MTDADMLRVLAEIRSLETAPVEVRIGETTETMAWGDLPSGVQNEFLYRDVDWTGFAPDEIADVTGRVIFGESYDELMDGVIIERNIAEREAKWQAEKTYESPPEPVEWEWSDQALFREWRDDASQRPLAEKGVDYSQEPGGQEYADMLRQAAEMANYRDRGGIER